MNQDTLDDEILIETRGGLGIITLNRPQVLNALSLEMIRTIASTLYLWERKDEVKAVVFQGSGGKAFSAGGDIKSFYKAGMDCRKGLVSPRVPVVFFEEEYSLNKQIFDYPKPSVAVMNGITMGGGYGLGGHCDVRIVGPKTVLAMPEVGIGFFPDVGSLYQLNRCPGNYGRYLALSGASIDGYCAAAAGLADIYMEDCSVVLDMATRALDVDDFKGAMIEALGSVGDQEDMENSDVIESVFVDFDVQAILQRLDVEGLAFARETASVMRGRSPTSLAVTARHLEKSENGSFDEIIATDFVLVQNFVRQGDMYEGIRAQIIDKDKDPNWLPNSLEAVSEDNINTYFTPTGYDLEDVQIFEI